MERYERKCQLCGREIEAIRPRNSIYCIECGVNAKYGLGAGKKRVSMSRIMLEHILETAEKVDILFDKINQLQLQLVELEVLIKKPQHNLINQGEADK